MRLAWVTAALVPMVLGMTKRQQADRIQSLPGLKFATNFDMYAGYLCASPNCHRHLFYWLMESQNSPKTDPLMVWFNGGPGCSSMLGLMYENSPIRPNQDFETLWENVYAWNKLGSTIYIEGPTGVGFSYADNVTVQQHHDDIDAPIEFFTAISDFLSEVRPDLQQNGVWITGESYAGVYIPLVTKLLVDNPGGLFKGVLKGFAIGNGLFNQRQQHNSIINLQYYRGVISHEMWEKLQAECCPGVCTDRCDFFAHLVKDPNGNDYLSDNTTCGDLVLHVSDELVSETRNDPYDLYMDCYKPRPKEEFNPLLRSVKQWHPAENNLEFVNTDSTDTNNGFSCWGNQAEGVYLNRPQVQAALHVSPSLTGNPGFRWKACNTNDPSTFHYTKLDFSPDMGPFFDHIFKNSDARLMVYNGDTDSACNWLMAQWFTLDFVRRHNLQSSGPREAWLYRDQIAGYVQRYGTAGNWRLDVATIKGAGHFVPTTRPGPMLQLLANFLWNTGNYSRPTGISDRASPLLQTSSAPTASSVLTLFLGLFVLFLN